MKMKKALFAALMCMTAAMATAQLDIDTLGNYEERFTRLNKAYAKEPDNVEALYNMSLFYFDNSHPMRNLPMAMKYIQRAEARHIVLLEEDRFGELTRLARKNITLTTLRQTKQAIIDAAYNTLEVRTDMSRVELDTYLDAFGIDIELVRLLRQRRINQVYDEDLRKGTAEAYYHFIDIYPGTNEAELMEERLSRLAPGLFEGVASEAAADTIAARFPLSPSINRAAMKQKSRLAYAEASRRNTIAAYNDYLNRYPSGDENVQAREKLARMLESQYSSLSTTKEYAAFVEANADNALADSALAEMRRLIVKNRDIEAARYYLSHFKQDDHYGDVYNIYYNWHAEEGNGAPIKRFAKEHPDFPYQRAIEADLERAEKIDRIMLFEDFIDVDFERYAGYVRRLTGKRAAFVPLQRMLQTKLLTRNYQAALERVRQFDLCFESVDNDEYNELLGILRAPATGRSLTKEFSSSYNILNPCVNPADGRLYFTRSTGSSANRICYAVRQGNSWRAAGDAQFSNTDNEGLTLFGFYDGGKRMLLGSNGDIWIAELDGGQWRISDIPTYPVNTDYNDVDAYMLPDGSGMLLASDRPGGQNLNQSGEYFHGDTAMASDLYFIPYTQNGWGTAVNLGIKVNSPYSERSPIMSRNLKTLYFVTDSRGLGFGDVYMATRNSVEDWASWSTPVNVGKELNTGFAEKCISFSPDEKRIYVSSNYSLGRYSCYSFATSHNTTDSYETQTIDILGMEGMLYRVRVADMTQQSITQQIDCQGESQSVDISVHKDKRYAVLADAGMYFVPAIVVEPRVKTPRLRGYTLPVLIGMDKPLPLPAIEFEEKSSEIQPVSRMQLEQLAQFIKHDATCTLELIVNVRGRDDVYCYNLSLERGRAIRNLLRDMNIDESRVTISAYGNVNTKKGEAPGVSIRFRQQ